MTSNDLLILIIGLLVLLLIVVLVAASRSKPKNDAGPASFGTGGGSSADYGGFGPGPTIDDPGIHPDGGFGRGEPPSAGGDRKGEKEPDESGHDIDRILVSQTRTNLVICPNCDTENIRGESRCIACDYFL